MQLDLEMEHESAYGEEQGKYIDELTDKFDVFLDLAYINQSINYAVDVFPCDKDIDIEIPKIIQCYYDGYFDKEYIKKMKLKFSKPLELTKYIEGDMEDVFFKIFGLNASDKRRYDEEFSYKYYLSIKNLCAELGEMVGSKEAVAYSLSNRTFSNLSEQYWGSTYGGYAITIKGYTILAILGHSE